MLPYFDTYRALGNFVELLGTTCWDLGPEIILVFLCVSFLKMLVAQNLKVYGASCVTVRTHAAQVHFTPSTVYFKNS